MYAAVCTRNGPTILLWKDLVHMVKFVRLAPTGSGKSWRRSLIRKDVDVGLNISKTGIETTYRQLAVVSAVM
jgi:hypothetical protein